MTVIRPNSVSGINSITAQANEIKVFKSDGTQGGLIIGGANLNATSGISTLLALNVTGNVSIAGTLTYQDVTNVDSLGIGTFRTGINVSGGQLDVGSNIKLGNAGVITATSFVGSGANLTSLPAQATIANNADNRVITGGSGVNLNGEANMTFDGSLLKIASRAVIGNGSEYQIPSRSNTSSYTPQFQITGAWNNPTHGATLALNGRNDYPLLWLNSGASYQDNSGCGVIVWSIKDGAGNYCNTAEIRSFVDGTPGNNDSPGDLSFRTTPDGTCQATERLRIDSSGRVVIGGNYTPYSGANMEIRSTDSGGDTQLRITNNATGANTKAGIVFTTSTGDYASGSIRYERNVGVAQGSGGNMGTFDALVFTAWAYGSANPWSGNTQNGMYLWGQSGTGQGGVHHAIGIGTDIPPQNTNSSGANSNGPALFCTAEGGNAITLLGRTPTPAGNDDIVGINFAARNYFGTTGRSGLTYQIVCQNGHGSYGDRGQLRFNPGYNGNSNSDGKGMVMEFNGHFRPTHDNAQNLGSGSLRWNTIYAANTSINNSDINLKQNIAGLSDAEMKAASRISKIFKTYRWKESVEEKGSDKARIHTGVIAQTVKTELEAEGLDPSKYAFYCQDTGWYKDGVLLGDGITHGPGVYDKLNDETPSTVGFTSSTTYAIRYVELLSFLAAYNEQRFTSIESRLTALEGS